MRILANARPQPGNEVGLERPQGDQGSRVEPLECQVKRGVVLPVEVAQELPVVQVTLEYQEPRHGQAIVQARTDSLHLVVRFGQGPVDVGLDDPALGGQVGSPPCSQGGDFLVRGDGGEQVFDVGGEDVGHEPGHGLYVEDDAGSDAGRDEVVAEGQVGVQLERGVVGYDTCKE